MNGMDSISPQVFLNRYMDLCIVGRVREGSRTLSGFNADSEGASRTCKEFRGAGDSDRRWTTVRLNRDSDRSQ